MKQIPLFSHSFRFDPNFFFFFLFRKVLDFIFVILKIKNKLIF